MFHQATVVFAQLATDGLKRPVNDVGNPCSGLIARVRMEGDFDSCHSHRSAALTGREDGVESGAVMVGKGRRATSAKPRRWALAVAAVGSVIFSHKRDSKRNEMKCPIDNKLPYCGKRGISSSPMSVLKLVLVAN